MGNTQSGQTTTNPNVHLYDQYINEQKNYRSTTTTNPQSIKYVFEPTTKQSSSKQYIATTNEHKSK